MIPNSNINPIPDLAPHTDVVGVDKNGVLVGTESILNFIEGAGITLTVTDNPPASTVNIQIDATGSGSVPTSRTLTIDGTPSNIVVTPNTAQDLSANRSWVVNLIDTAVTPATYGSATQVGSFTVDQKGRLTDASNITVTPAASSITGGAALTSGNDTNVTLTLGGTPATALLVAASITAGWTGTLAAGRLNSNVVQAVTNDTNVTGSIAAQILTLGWTGTLADARLSTTTVTPGSYGSATQVGTFTVGATGRLTAASNVTITPAAGSITGAGNLTVGTSLSITSGSGTGATLVSLGINTIQGIRTADSPQFVGLTLSNSGVTFSSATNNGLIFPSGTSCQVKSPTADVISFITSGNEEARIDSLGRILSGLTSTDAGAGISFIGAGKILTATSSVNASTLELVPIGGGAQRIVSGISGAGTYQPLTFYTNNTLAVTISTGQVVTLANPLPVASGGTNLASYTTGDVLYASAGTTIARLADVATGNAIISGGVGVAPSYGKIGLTTHVSGTLAVGNGGTGVTALANLTVGSSLSITSGSGTGAVIVALGINTIQGITTTSTPQFSKLGLNSAADSVATLIIINTSPASPFSALSVISNSASGYTALSVGRTAPETYLGAAGGANSYLSGTAAGDGTLFSSGKLFLSANVSPGGTAIMVLSSGAVVIGATTITASALLDLSSTTGALLVPRMTTTQRDALTAANGMIVYNTTTGALNYRKAGVWTAI